VCVIGPHLLPHKSAQRPSAGDRPLRSRGSFVDCYTTNWSSKYSVCISQLTISQAMSCLLALCIIPALSQLGQADMGVASERVASLVYFRAGYTPRDFPATSTRNYQFTHFFIRLTFFPITRKNCSYLYFLIFVINFIF
jgi:hypothetical protein